MLKIISTVVRIIVAAGALIMLVWVNLNFFTAGTVIGSVLFVAILLGAILWKPLCALIKLLWSKIPGRIAVIVVGGAAGICAVLCAIFSINMAACMDKPLDDTKAVIVLGCQVKGEQPSTMLAFRLVAAADVLEEHPEAVCVVSGGQGNGEDIPEAEAMRRYLIELGIDDSRIIKEDRSVSTRENIRFSAALLSERGITDNVVIVTSDFHQYRADIYARKNGYKTVGHRSSKTPARNIANYWIREWAAIMAVHLGL